jgi:hypothetical protein
VWAHAVFDFVAAEYGTQGLRQYLAALRTGSDSTRVAFGVAATDFDQAFQVFVRRRLGDR